MLRRMRTAALLLVSLQGMTQAPEWPDPGLPATRDMFPLNLISIPYTPLRATPLGQGNSLISLQVVRSNTFEFSGLIKSLLEPDLHGRVKVDRVGAETLAREHPDEPLIYFFDMEVQRTVLDFRVGLTPKTDLGLALAWQGTSGGLLDNVIEGFHQLGFKQVGRENIANDQLSIVVIQRGEVVVFSQRSTRAHPEDPILTVLQRIHESADWTISLSGSLKVPLTRWNGVYRSDWDASASLLCQWRPSEHHTIDLGGGYLRRGIKDGGPSPFFIKDQGAGHLGWEWRRWPWVRPYFLLIGTSGLVSAEPGSKLHKSALIHDVGIHLRLGKSTALTLSYINNISHNENTADVGVALRLSVRVPSQNHKRADFF